MQCEQAGGRASRHGRISHVSERAFREQPRPRVFSLHVPVLCVLGFSLYLGWIFCLFWSPALFPAGVLGDVAIHAVRMAMTGALPDGKTQALVLRTYLYLQKKAALTDELKKE